MNTQLYQWLQQEYQGAPVSGPQCKRIKFCDVMERVPPDITPITPFVLSQAIQTQFPHTINKRAGKQRQTFIYGIEFAQYEGESQQPEKEPTQQENEALKRRVEELEKRVQELEQASTLPQRMDDEMHALVHPSASCYHGPDTVDRLQSFSIDSLVAEFRANAPDVVCLMSQLARSERFDEDNLHTRIATLRTTTALCTLVKGRSTKVLGLQLLITFMLIARATNKQVV